MSKFHASKHSNKNGNLTISKTNKKFRKKRKNMKISQHIAKQSILPKSDISQSIVSKKKVKELSINGEEDNAATQFKPVYIINKPEDYSANWKQLKNVLTKNDRKRPRSIAKVLRQNEVKKQTQQHETNAFDDDDEIWFDDVDPLLIEESRRSHKRAKAEKEPDVKTLKPGSNSNISQAEILQMGHAYAGPTKVIALDCEMVGGGYEGQENILARVSLVNQYGNVIYDKFVKPGDRVIDYRTEVSGVRPTDLVNAETFSTVQKEVFDLINGRILVGHALSNDMSCLLLSHSKNMIRDTSRYKPFIRLIGGGQPSLKKLSAKVLGVEIQSGEHSSVQDAQAAMRLYTLNRKQWEEKLHRKQMPTRNDKKSGISKAIRKEDIGGSNKTS